MTVTIVPTAAPYFEGLYHALDTVARERKYIAFLQAPPIEEAFAFFHTVIANDFCEFLALQNGVVVGWCHILPVHGDQCKHVGILGIGLVPSARHQGIGSQLMKAAIKKAWTKDFSRIELTVRTDNTNAKALYERFGFSVEGVKRRLLCIDDEFFDTYMMALVR